MIEQRKCYVGQTSISSEGYILKITDILEGRKVKIKILDAYEFEHITTLEYFKKGKVKNPYHRSVYGVGFYGDGKYTSKLNGKHFYYYRVWQSMHNRCYSGKENSYKNVTVCSEWNNYQNFAEWFHKTFPFELLEYDMRLDKDLLQQGIENKVYSKEKCVWIPKRINSYIQAKRRGTLNEFKGVSFNKDKWEACSTLFEKGGIRYKIGTYKTQEEAINAYKEFKLIQDEKAKDYLRSLNYLPEEIIQLIKTV